MIECIINSQDWTRAFAAASKFDTMRSLASLMVSGARESVRATGKIYRFRPAPRGTFV